MVDRPAIGPPGPDIEVAPVVVLGGAEAGAAPAAGAEAEAGVTGGEEGAGKYPLLYLK